MPNPALSLPRVPRPPRSAAWATLLLAATLVLGAGRAEAIALTLAGVNGQSVGQGGQIAVTVSLDTEGATGIVLLSVGVLFDDTRLSYNQGASSTASYTLYNPNTAAKGQPNNGEFLMAANTCGGYVGTGGPNPGGGCGFWVGVTNQVNVDFFATDLSTGTSQPTGTTAGQGTTSGGVLATLIFDVIGTSGVPNIDISITAPGNVIGLPGGASGTASLSGSVTFILTPDDCYSSGYPCADDRDGDGILNQFDDFPDDPSETTDSDGDGVGDNGDNCPAIANPDQLPSATPGIGAACHDEDSDGTLDAGDNCPLTPNGDQLNSDADTLGDACDNCPGNANIDQANQDGDTFGDVCDDDRDGDGVPNQFDDFPDDPSETSDSDGDGVGDNTDNCLVDANPGQEDTDGNGVGDACNSAEDADGDDWADGLDNCPADFNPDQSDINGDLVGDVCDPDADSDGVPSATDNCPLISNAGQEDADGNGVGDVCNDFEDTDGDDWADGLDNCPADFNPDQADLDGDLVGNVCDPDADSDGVPSATDNCPLTPNPGQEDTDANGVGNACNSAEDADADEWSDTLDNCPADANTDQADGDGDTVGDVCDNCPMDPNTDQIDTSGNGDGDVCNDADEDGLRDSIETNTGLFIDTTETGTDPNNPDTDGDGLPDGLEVLDYTSNPHDPDTDADTIGDASDNCVLVANTDQANADGAADDDTTAFPPIDHYGDVCDADINNDGIVNTADFFGHFRPCFGEAVVNTPSCAAADFDGNGITNTGDFFGYFLPGFGGKPGPGVREIPTYTFTTCGQTGRTGPSQAQCDAAYAGTDLEGKVTVVGGIQEWTVPYIGTYSIETLGAQGGRGYFYGSVGGLGARMSGLFQIGTSLQLKVLPGQVSGLDAYCAGGGGGGSFVTDLTNAPLIIAGGGGGNNSSYNGYPGLTGNSGGNGYSGGAGGSNGSGGGSYHASGGGGLLGNGSTGSYGSPGLAFTNGATGGNYSSSPGAIGGFGGGGGTHGRCGGGAGGGGYSGGGGGRDSNGGGGGGGGSYNAGTNPDNAAGVNAGPGQVTITFITPAPQAAQAPVSAASLNINALWDRDLDGVLDTADNCLETPNPGQLDADGDGFGNACDADLNNDGAVGLDDITAILGAAGTTNNPAADINGDGGVGLDDVTAALGMLGTPPGPGAEACGLANPCF